MLLLLQRWVLLMLMLLPEKRLINFRPRHLTQGQHVQAAG
jgi:hypothetical protein